MSSSIGDGCPLVFLILAAILLILEAVKMDRIERDRLIEQMVRTEVDRWDMDTLIDYAVEHMFEYMEEAEDAELATMWEQLFGEDDNPFEEVEK